MGLVDKIETKKQQTPFPQADLSVEEYEFLLQLIKRSTFDGADLDLLYKLVWKLQKQYIDLKENKQ